MVTFACWHLAVVAFLDGHSKNSLKLLLSPMQIFCEPGNLKMGKTIKKNRWTFYRVRSITQKTVKDTKDDERQGKRHERRAKDKSKKRERC